MSIDDSNPCANDTIRLYDPKMLAYGENKCQSPAVLLSTRSDDPLAMTKFEWVSGTPSYISMADGAQILDILCLLAESFRRSKMTVPYIVIAGKHGNPCGAAISFDDPLEAIDKALMGNTVAVMGGEVITNFPIGDAEAWTLLQPSLDNNIGRDKWGLDLVIAPHFSEGAVNLLGKREKRRLLANPALKEASFPQNEWVYRPVRADWLRQKAPTFALTMNAVQLWSRQTTNALQFQNALIAFACCWRASSNTVALANNNMLIGLGCGQQDRIECVRLAISRANRAGHDTEGSIFASDAFFPYATSKSGMNDISRQILLEAIEDARLALEAPVDDHSTTQILSRLAAIISREDQREGTELLIDAGCAGGIVPADGKELENVTQLFEENGLAVGFVPPEFRGFSKH